MTFLVIHHSLKRDQLKEASLGGNTLQNILYNSRFKFMPVTDWFELICTRHDQSPSGNKEV